MLLFLTTNMAAVTSRTNGQSSKTRSSPLGTFCRRQNVPSGEERGEKTILVG